MTDLNPFRSRRVRITEPGWETFSDTFGTVLFDNGLSVEAVSFLEQQRLGSLIRMESAEDEEQGQEIGPTAELVRGRNLMADSDLVRNVDRAVVVGGETRLAASTFSRSELEEVADRKGLAGLRDIAAPLGVKGRSVNDMITAILQAQDGAPVSAATPVSTPAED